MPRETVAEFTVDHVQVLDREGTVDTDLEPDLGEDRLEELYRLMKLARRFEERAIALQRRGEIGTYAPAVGQEAAQIGSASALAAEDWMTTSFRESAAYLARGTPVDRLLCYAMGMEEGAEVPEGSRSMAPSIAVGSQALHGVGIGWGQAMLGEEGASLVYFGDGATSEGDVYEALNLAGVYDARTVLFCQNNQYAISVPREKQSRAETLAQKAIAAGIEGIQVDGNDVLGVYAVTRAALSRAREGRPTLVEAITYRRSMHTTADDPSVYREPEEERDWEAYDPIDRFETYLRERGVLDDDLIATIEEGVEADLEEGIERAMDERESVDPAEMFEYAYADLPPWVQRQREAFEEGPEGASGADTGGEDGE